MSAFTRSRAKFNCRCDYWENKKNYKRVQKLSQSSQDMITNIRRECKRYKRGESLSSAHRVRDGTIVTVIALDVVVLITQ